MNKTLVSVVIPVFNEEKNIGDTIDSILNQTFKNFELIIINDGSNDIHLVKSAPIPVGSQLQLIDGGAKIVVQSGDVIKVVSDTASSCDVWVSAVDAIST